MNEYVKVLTDEVLIPLVEHGIAENFVKALKLRAENIVRNLPATPVENRQMAEGQALFCLELADGAIAAIKAKEAEAKADFARDNPEEDSLV